MAWFFLHPSGGLFYHLRALRHRRALWAPFHDQVGRWLSDWRPPCDRLVLIGPSAGYALPRAFLERFHEIQVLEPDPLARRLLRRRFAGIPLAFAELDLAAADGPAQLARRYPWSAFLFCNLLGQQLVGSRPDFDRRTWLASLEAALAGRDWASWHELISTEQPPRSLAGFHCARIEALESLCEHYWPGGELTLVDHDTGGLRPWRPRQYALWPLTRRRFHLIEWIA